ncbi:hypothetical protein RB195_003798 [Necator americanus]|uniref:Secreted protein n=1 Tax=Necator americanus TaxID=51031 RepID=A0ABR1DQ88_NECAM
MNFLLHLVVAIFCCFRSCFRMIERSHRGFGHISCSSVCDIVKIGGRLAKLWPSSVIVPTLVSAFVLLTQETHQVDTTSTSTLGSATRRIHALGLLQPLGAQLVPNLIRMDSWYRTRMGDYIRIGCDHMARQHSGICERIPSKSKSVCE